MGNALSWLIAKMFGDKEARILILGLDNGTWTSASADDELVTVVLPPELR
jgi:hypothetical protein